jgi:hypothetical protein
MPVICNMLSESWQPLGGNLCWFIFRWAGSTSSYSSCRRSFNPTLTTGGGIGFKLLNCKWRVYSVLSLCPDSPVIDGMALGHSLSCTSALKLPSMRWIEYWVHVGSKQFHFREMKERAYTHSTFCMEMRHFCNGYMSMSLCAAHFSCAKEQPPPYSRFLHYCMVRCCR